MRRTSWIVIVLAAAALVASACTSDEGTATDEDTGTQSGEQVTLDFWLLNEIETGTVSFYDTLVSEFEAAHPNVHVELTEFPEENYDVKVDTAVAAGKLPISPYSSALITRGRVWCCR